MDWSLVYGQTNTGENKQTQVKTWPPHGGTVTYFKCRNIEVGWVG